MHRLSTTDTKVNAEPIASLSVTFPPTGAPPGTPRLAWHPSTPDVLFFTSSHVVHVAVLSQLASSSSEGPPTPTIVDAVAPHLPPGVYSLPWGAVAIAALSCNLAVTGDGLMLAIATEDGRVCCLTVFVLY